MIKLMKLKAKRDIANNRFIFTKGEIVLGLQKEDQISVMDKEGNWHTVVDFVCGKVWMMLNDFRLNFEQIESINVDNSDKINEIIQREREI